jgi:hypothetical protein
MHGTVVTHDDLTKQGFFWAVKSLLFFLDRFCQISKTACFFLDREGFPAETGSLAPLRGSKRSITLYQIYIVHFIARSGRLQSDRSKTLV